MALIAFRHIGEFCILSIIEWVSSLHSRCRSAVVASMLVAFATLYVGIIVSGQIRENAVQRAASSAALYMDGFIALHVQELATEQVLSPKVRDILERLLSPASMHRPVIGFRVWKGDTVVFSNERNLIGKSFGRTAARERAWQGQIGVEFDQLDGEDDEQVRSLQLPLLEVYAPVRQKGTDRIIALVETYEIGVELKRELLVNQLFAWIVVITVAFMVFVPLFSMARKIGELTHHRAQSEQQRRRIARANMKVSETNESNLRRIDSALQHGPVQNVTLALLKLDPVNWAFCDANGAVLPGAIQCMEDLEAIRDALSKTIRQMRAMTTDVVPPRVDDLSPGEALARAAREHHRQSGQRVDYDVDALPDQLPTPLKACLYRIALDGLKSTAGGTQSQSIRASAAEDSLTLEIIGGAGDGETPAKLARLRDRIEALGGTLGVDPTAAGQLSLIAEINLSDMGINGG
jgi:hypothetical protein